MTDARFGETWDRHADQPDAVAEELEAAAGAGLATPLLPEFARIAAHTVGEHLGDWPRAARLISTAVQPRRPDAETAKAWAHLWVSQSLAGDPAAAASTELTYLAAAGADVWPALLEARFLLVAALVGTGRAAEAAAIYVAALALAHGLSDAAPHRAIAVASNNLASELVEAPARTPDEAALMRVAAEAARKFWLKCGTWLHDERSLYLLALVANVLSEPVEAIGHADAGLAVIAANGAAPIDETFLRLARAHALKLAGDDGASAAELAISDAAAGAWENPGLKSWYAEQRARTIGI